MKLIGPFKQVVTLANLPLRGKLSDEQIEIIVDGGILVNENKIHTIGNFETLKSENQNINKKFKAKTKFLKITIFRLLNNELYNGFRIQ